MHKKVAPTLDYLLQLKAEGCRVVDVWLTAFNQDMRKMQVFLADGEVREFLLDDSPQVLPHYRDAIEFAGYGPRGLSNLIYMEALQFARDQGLRSEDVEVRISQGCFDRAGREIEHYLAYGFAILVDPGCSGMEWRIQRKG